MKKRDVKINHKTAGSTLARGCLLALALLLSTPFPGAAQILGPILDDGDFELGGQYMEVKRDSEKEELFDSSGGSIFFRYGLSNTATLSGELLVGNTLVIDSETNSRYYLAGAGLQARLWAERKSLVTGGFHVTKGKRISKNGAACDADYTTLLWTVLVETTYRVKRCDVSLLVGPSYLYESEYVYAGRNGCRTQKRNSVDNLGYAVGLNAILYDHYQVFVHDVFAGYHQPRVGFSYRF